MVLSCYTLSQACAGLTSHSCEMRVSNWEEGGLYGKVLAEKDPKEAVRELKSLQAGRGTDEMLTSQVSYRLF
jgi:hypothetical protein